MKDSDSLLKFWVYCAERWVLINNLTAKGLHNLQGSNANQLIADDADDISNLCQFGWFEWCYFKDKSPFPHQEEKLGRCLGPAKYHSNEMLQWILKHTMQITASHTVRRLTEKENRDLNIKRDKKNIHGKLCQ